MSVSRRLVHAALMAVAAGGLAGCGATGPAYAPVSGVVTLNGQPYKSALVRFQPIAGKDNSNPGRGSYGHTDENGRFQLVVDDKIKGAAVGRHRIRIVTTRENPSATTYDPELGTPDGSAKLIRELLPPEWHANSTKEFEVPSGGTDKANFDIVTKKKP